MKVNEHSLILATLCVIALVLFIVPPFFIDRAIKRAVADCAAKGGEFIQTRSKDFCVKKDSLL